MKRSLENLIREFQKSITLGLILAFFFAGTIKIQAQTITENLEEAEWTSAVTTSSNAGNYTGSIINVTGYNGGTNATLNIGSWRYSSGYLVTNSVQGTQTGTASSVYTSNCKTYTVHGGSYAIHLGNSGSAYIMTPLLPNGVTSISFWVRTASTSASVGVFMGTNTSISTNNAAFAASVTTGATWYGSIVSTVNSTLGWAQVSVNVTGAGTSAPCYLNIHRMSSEATIDDIVITTPSTCTTPTLAYNVTTSSSTICNGSPVTLGLNSSQSGVTYQLYAGASPVGATVAGTGAAISFAAQSPASTTTYTVQSTTAGGYCAVAINGGSPSSQVVTVNALPSIGSQSTAGASYALNGTASPISVTAAGAATLSYQWYSSTDNSNSTIGDDLAVGTNSNSYTPLTTSAGTLYYYCIVNSSTCATPVTSAISGAIIVAPGAPTLVAAANQTVDNNFNITFTEDATWRAAVTSITVDGISYTSNYSFGVGTLALTTSAIPQLQTAGSHTIVVVAGGYANTSVIQTNIAGTPTKLGITTQPTAPASNGAVLGTTSVVKIQDQYGNTTTSTADIVATVGAGAWAISGTTTVTAVAGSSSFSNLIATSAGAVTGATVIYTCGALTTATSNGFNIPAPVAGAQFYRSVTDGNWASASTWEMSTDGSTGWTGASTAPDGLSKGIEIKAGTTVTVAASLITPAPTPTITIQVNGTLAVASTFSLTLGTNMTVNSGGNLTLTGSTAAQLVTTGKVLTVTGTGQLTNGNTSTTAITSSATTLFFTSGGTYNHTASAGAVPTANWTSSGASNVVVTGITTGATAFEPSLNQAFYNLTWNCASQATQNLILGYTGFTVNGNLNIISTGSASIQLSKSGQVLIPVVGSYTQSGGDIFIYATAGRGFTCNGDFALSGGTFDITKTGQGTSTTGQSLTIKGNFNQTGGTLVNSLAASTNNIVFNGAAPQTATFGTLSGGLYMAINNTNATASSRIVTLGSDLTLSSLTLTQGYLSLGGHNLTLTAATPVAGTLGTANHIITGGSGYVSCTTTTTNYTFPVGPDATHYAPLTITNTGGTTQTYTVGVGNGVTTTYTTPLEAAGWDWYVGSNGASASTLAFSWLTADAGATLGASPVVGTAYQYAGSTWTDRLGTTVINTPNTTTVTGVTDFTDTKWAVAKNACMLPTLTYNVTTSSASICNGSPVTLGLDNSQSGVTYQLYAGATPVGSPVVGTGAAITFAAQSPASTTTYTVRSTTAGGYCAVAINGGTASQVVTVNALPTITLGANPTVPSGASLANLTFSATTGSPDQYAISWVSGPSNVAFTSLPASPIVINTTSVADGTYSGTLTVKNTTTGCVSSGYSMGVTLTSAAAPTVTTQAVSSIATTTATGNGTITSIGSASISASGVCWKTTAGASIADSKTTDGATTATTYTSSMTGLTANTLYYVNAYATNSVGTSYGTETSFTTLSLAPTVAAGTGITTTGFTANWTAPGAQGAAAYTYTVQVTSTSGNYSSPVASYTGIASGTLTKAVTGLTAGTNYWYRVIAVNAGGNSTPSVEQAVTTTGSGASNYDYTTEFFETSTLPTSANSTETAYDLATGTWRVKNVIRQTTTVYAGVQAAQATSTSAYIISPNLTSGVGTVSLWFNSGSNRTITIYTSTDGGTTWSSVLTTFSYTQNSGWVQYSYDIFSPPSVNRVKIAFPGGSGSNFDNVLITSTILPPTVTTQAVNNITTTTANGNATITALGGGVTSSGLCWKTSTGPTISDSKTTDGPTTAIAYNGGLTGLTANTTYYVKAYATGPGGTSYGSEVTFTTSPNAPTVGLGSGATPTSITANWTAPSGGAAAYSYIVEVDDDSNFGSVNSTSGSIPSGTLTYTATGLTAATTYYFHVKAVNATGSSVWSSTSIGYATTAPTAPTVTTQAVSGITKITATGNGTNTSNGGSSITASGVCWSTTSGSETIGGSHTTDGGTSTGAFTSSMTGLTANTTYYVKAYATNAQGTSYGTEVSFTTSPLSTACDITAFSIPSQLSATIVGTNISVTMPAGTVVSSLTPTVTTSAFATYLPSGARNFTSPVAYTVTAEDGTTTKQYTVTVTVNAPVITLCCSSTYSFTTTGWSASASQTIDMTALDLEADVSIVVDAPFQVSTDNQVTWVTNGTIIRSGTTASGPLYIRYNPASGLSHSGTITFSSQGAVSQIIALEGVADVPQAKYFRSKAKGAWDNLATWETSSDRTNWTNATVVPTVLSPQILIRDSVNIPVGVTATASNLQISATAKLINNGTLNLSDSLVYESTDTHTAQLFNNGTITNTGVIKLEKTMLKASKWYFMDFPFDVAANHITNASTGAPLTINTDYYARYYDGASRDALGSPNTSGSGVYWVDEILPLKKNKGYIIATVVDMKIAFTSAANETDLFATTASTSVGKYVTNAAASNHSWNLKGNPFSCGFDMSNATQTHAPFYIFDGSTYQTIMSGDHYKVYPFTAFFLQAFGASNTLDFSNAGRLFKSAEIVQDSITFDEVELYIEKDGMTDIVRIRINDASTNNFDPQIDGVKFLSTVTTVPQIYSKLNGKSYSVNSLPPVVGGPTTVPLSVYIPTITGSYTIRMVNSQKIKRFSQVLLTDSIAGTSTDLLQDSVYTFNSATTGISTRMALILENTTIPTSVSLINTGISIHQSDNVIYFTGLDSDANVSLFDASGRLMKSYSKVTNNQVMDVPRDGVYVVSVTTKSNSYHKKIIIK